MRVFAREEEKEVDKGEDEKEIEGITEIPAGGVTIACVVTSLDMEEPAVSFQDACVCAFSKYHCSSYVDISPDFRRSGD